MKYTPVNIVKYGDLIFSFPPNFIYIIERKIGYNKSLVFYLVKISEIAESKRASRIKLRKVENKYKYSKNVKTNIETLNKYLDFFGKQSLVKQFLECVKKKEEEKIKQI